MKLFSRLFRKTAPAPAPTLQERIVSLREAPAEVVTNTALGRDEESLRIAATRMLPEGDALRVLAGFADPPQDIDANMPSAVRQAAQERLAQLIDEGAIDFAALSSDKRHSADAMTVAALCKCPDRLNEVLARIDEPSELARLAIEGPTSRVRQSAAAAIEDPAQLHDLLPRARGKDKTVYRIIKRKCDTLNAEIRQAEEAARESEKLCASLEKLSMRAHHALYATTLEGLTARWRGLALRPAPEVAQRGEQALERCAAVIAEHERALAEQTARHAAELEARATHRRTLEADRRAEQERAEAQAKERAAVAAAREAEELVRAEQRATQAQVQREVAGLIRLSRDSTQRGNTKKAARFRQAIEVAIQDGAPMPAHLTRQLQQLDEKLNELKQWKDYVVAPKRIELIEEMEALIGSSEEPEALAEHIRALQQEWRTINKGIAGEESEDRERFQTAFHAAFEPCQEYFAAQAAIRRDNVEKRRQVLQRLKTFEANMDADDPDYRLLEMVLREAPQEWRSHSPIDPKANHPIEIEFHLSMERLRKIRKAWWDRNEAAKRALIAQAQHLATAEDAASALDEVKRLQASWKETGPLSRNKSQALWREFRGLCDAVFKKRAEAYALHAADLEAAKTRAIALCEEIEEATGVSAEERLASNAKIGEWQAVFGEVGELPRAEARGLQNRFERAITRYGAKLAEQDLRDAEAAESRLLEAGRHIRAYERAVMLDATPEERDTLRNAAEAFIASVKRWPGGGQQALEQALARADVASGGDDEVNEKALRMLCIRGEILSSTTTPAEDEALRRDYQMRMLTEGLGQVRQADNRDWDAMLVEWIGVGAIAPEAHEDLERRFMRCLARRPARSPSGPASGDYEGSSAGGRGDRSERKSRRDRRSRSDSGPKR